MDLYLITGFLGAGKTTFLKNFIRRFSGRRIRLIINEFGKAGVDGALLDRLGAVMREISNGSIFCACRLDKFEEELHRAMDDGPDVLLVEASGLANPTGVQCLLEQEEFAPIHYRGSICLVDTPRLERVIHTARVCPRQIMVSSLILLNKTDLATPEQLEAAARTIRDLNPTAVIRQTSFGAFRPEWLEDIHPLGGEISSDAPDITLQKQLLHIPADMTQQQLLKALGMIAEDTWRIKGIVVLEGKRLLVDCVGPKVQVVPTEAASETENQLALLAGPGMPLRKAIKEAIRWYPGLTRE